MIPIVLDTNVLVSGLLSKKGPPGKIMELILQREIILCLDRRIRDEYQNVIHRPELKIDKVEADWVLDFIFENSVFIKASPVNIDLPDPDDLMFIEVALKANIIIVTGNKRHFPAYAIGKSPVLSPAEFLKHIQ